MIEKERSAKMFNIPVAAKTPEPFPQPTINTQRALCALSMSNPSKLPDAFAALYHAFWVERVAIGKPEVFGPILAKVLGESAAKGVMEKVCLTNLLDVEGSANVEVDELTGSEEAAYG